jgi:hypothetical protein
MLRIFLIVSLLFTFEYSGSNNTDNGLLSNGLLTWKNHRKLNWSDFKGVPAEGSPFSAACNWQIDYTYHYQLNEGDLSLEFDVNSYFNQLNSWSKKDEENQRLLDHEQLHFDIAEVYARKLRKRFDETKFDKRNSNQQASQIFKETLNECHKIQEAYDEETNHGLHEEHQTNWSLNVDNQLNSFDRFAKN